MPTKITWWGASALNTASRRLGVADLGGYERVSEWIRRCIAPGSRAEYEELRSDAHQFAVHPGHVYPDVESVVARLKGYNVVRVADLPKLAPHLDWSRWLAAEGLTGKVDSVIVSQPGFIKGLDGLLARLYRRVD